MPKDITLKMLKDFREEYKDDPKNKVIESIITTNGIRNAALNKEAVHRDIDVFSIELPKVKITNQKRSGRCWAFAGLNLLKREVAKNLNINLETFELSANYITFYDKLEKANNFYETIIDFKDRKLMDRELLLILDWALYDGGTWQFLIELVKKYGIVPITIMPETKDSVDSEALTDILSTKVRKDAVKLRKLMKDGVNIDEVRTIKDRMLQEVYNILCKTLGQPPEEFRYEYFDKDRKYSIINSITPMEFYNKYVDMTVDDYILIANAPMHNKEYGKMYREKDYIKNITGVSSQYFLNVEIDELKDFVIKSLKDGEPVYFGANVTKMKSRDLGIFDDELYQFDEILDIDLKMSREEMLDYRDICMQHMMLFTGVNIVENKVDRWKVENSWGDDGQNRGFFIMNDNFFDKYVLECLINKKYLSDEQLELLDQEPVLFDPWDSLH